MYRVMLASNNSEFVAGIDRNPFRHRTEKLKTVVSMLQELQKHGVSQLGLSNLLTALYNWRAGEPHEYDKRGGTNGVAYRLWMEAKQMIRNTYHQDVNARWADPPMPAGCPGDVVLGVYVPPGEGSNEVCHRFAYRWAVAAGKMRETGGVEAAAGGGNGDTMGPVLYPGGFASLAAARANRMTNVQAGDIIAMYEIRPVPLSPLLGHSLIALTATHWFGANNVQTFATAPGRTEVDVTAPKPPARWVDGGNRWKRAVDDGVVSVVFRRL
jgi:hypothetical protein